MTPAFNRARFITYVALFVALAVLVPIGFHMMGIAGRIFLPMHIPVLLAGFIGGPLCGLIVGLLAPGLSFLLTGMPPTYAVPLMSIELPAYGLVAGLLYFRFNQNVILSLVVSMIIGRLMFALGMLLLGRVMDIPYTVAAYFSSGGAVVTGIPGIILQIILIPIIVKALQRYRLR